MSPVLGRPRDKVRRKTPASYVHYREQYAPKTLCGQPFSIGITVTMKVNLVTCPWCKDELDKK